MKTITIPTVASDYGPGHFKSEHQLEIDTVVYRGTQLTAKFGLGGWTKDGEGRLVTGGPMVKGPYAYAYNLGSCLSGDKSYYEQEAKIPTHHVEEDDLVVMAGTTYIVKITSCGSTSWVELKRKR